jgi:hypothetical protein
VRRRPTSLARKTSLTIRIGFIAARWLLSVVPIYGIIEATGWAIKLPLNCSFPVVLGHGLIEARCRIDRVLSLPAFPWR